MKRFSLWSESTHQLMTTQPCFWEFLLLRAWPSFSVDIKDNSYHASLYLCIAKLVFTTQLWCNTNLNLMLGIELRPVYLSWVCIFNISSHLKDCHCDGISLVGDCNLVLTQGKGRDGGPAKTHTKAVNAISEHATKFDLVDAWTCGNMLMLLRYQRAYLKANRADHKKQ